METLATGTYKTQAQSKNTAAFGSDDDVDIADAPPIEETRQAVAGETTPIIEAAVTAMKAATAAVANSRLATGEKETDQVLDILAEVRRAINDREPDEIQREILTGYVATGQAYIVHLQETIMGLQDQVQKQT